MTGRAGQAGGEVPGEAGSRQVATGGAGAPWTGRLAAAPRAERARLLEDLVVGRVRDALLMDGADPVPLDKNYFDLGLSSLKVVEIEQYLRAMLGRPVHAATILNNPTLAHLLAHLRTEVLPELFQSAQPGAAPGPGAGTGADPEAPRALLDGLLKELYEA